MATEKATSKDTRVRNYATVVYPDSAPENWRDILSEFHVPCFISPLHDKDINPNGEPKKPHYHVQLCYEGKKSIEQAQEVFNAIGGVGCEVVKSLRGYARYLCHLDNPEKAQYDTNGVTALCGLDYLSTIGLPIDKLHAIREMILFCEENNITSYRKLLMYSMEERTDWFKVLCESGTYVMKEYLKSSAWEKEQQNLSKGDE